MIPLVFSLEEAEKWFLTHSSGQIRCVRGDGAEMTVGTYPEALAFYDAETNAVGFPAAAD